MTGEVPSAEASPSDSSGNAVAVAVAGPQVVLKIRRRKFNQQQHHVGEISVTRRLFRSGDSAFRGIATPSPQNADFRFLRVRPPLLEVTESGIRALPHIRLDRALQFLIGDRLQ